MLSDSKYNFLDNKGCDTISSLYPCDQSGRLALVTFGGHGFKSHWIHLLRVQMTEQNKTIGQIRSQSSKKYNLIHRDMLGTGCIRHCFVSRQNPGLDIWFLPNALIGHSS